MRPSACCCCRPHSLRLRWWRTITAGIRLSLSRLTRSGNEENRERAAGFRFYIVPKEQPGQIIGMVALNNVVWGSFCSCFLGYKLDKDWLRQGLMSEAVNECVRIAFEELGLHRIEANIMPRNIASLGVVRRCGFVEEGLARKYLKINGVWEDHLHMVKLNED